MFDISRSYRRSTTTLRQDPAYRYRERARSIDGMHARMRNTYDPFPVMDGDRSRMPHAKIRMPGGTQRTGSRPPAGGHTHAGGSDATDGRASSIVACRACRACRVYVRPAVRPSVKPTDRTRLQYARIDPDRSHARIKSKLKFTRVRTDGYRIIVFRSIYRIIYL